LPDRLYTDHTFHFNNCLYTDRPKGNSGSGTPTEAVTPSKSFKSRVPTTAGPLLAESPDKAKSKRDKLAKSPRKNHRTGSVSFLQSEESGTPHDRTESPHKRGTIKRPDGENSETLQSLKMSPVSPRDLPKVQSLTLSVLDDGGIPKSPKTPKVPKTAIEIKKELATLEFREEKLRLWEAQILQQIKDEKQEILDRRKYLKDLYQSITGSSTT